MKALKICLGAFIVTLPGVWILFLLSAVGGNWFEIDMEIMQTALFRAMVVASAIATILALISLAFPANSERYTHVSGPKNLLGRRAWQHARKYLKVAAKTSGLFIHPKIKINRLYEIGNLFIFGMQGSGKSTIIKSWLKQIMKRQIVALIYDEKREYTEYFFNEHVLLLSPGDTRSVRWELSKDIVDISSARTFANSLITQTSNEPFWSDSARLVVCGAVVCLLRSGQAWGWAELYELLFRDTSRLQKQLRLHFPEAALFAGGDDRTSASVLGVISSQLSWISYIAETDNPDSTTFSVSSWLDADSPKKLIVQTDSAYRDMSQALFAALFSMVTSRVLNLPDSSTREIWLVLDELAAIPKNAAMEQWLSRGRSKGARTIAGVQSISQLQSIYSEKDAETLLGLFASVVVLRIGAPGASASGASKALGERRVLIKSTSTDINGEKSSTQAESIIPVVSPEEITHLESPDKIGVHGYLLIAGANAVYKLLWPYPELSPIAKPRISYVKDTIPELKPANQPGRNPFLKQRE